MTHEWTYNLRYMLGSVNYFDAKSSCIFYFDPLERESGRTRRMLTCIASRLTLSRVSCWSWGSSRAADPNIKKAALPSSAPSERLWFLQYDPTYIKVPQSAERFLEGTSFVRQFAQRNLEQRYIADWNNSYSLILLGHIRLHWLAAYLQCVWKSWLNTWASQ